MLEVDKEKTAFTCPSRLYHINNIPFGLLGAAATFQRLMDRVLQPLAYIDDLVVFSNSWPEHLHQLWKVLQQLREAGLTANPCKCHLGRSQVRYLGYVIGKGLLQAQPDKVKALMWATFPQDKKGLQWFLGPASYYRHFTSNFASRTTPLTALLHKGIPPAIAMDQSCFSGLACGPQ